MLASRQEEAPARAAEPRLPGRFGRMTPEIGSEYSIAQLCRVGDTAEIKRSPRTLAGPPGLPSEENTAAKRHRRLSAVAALQPLDEKRSPDERGAESPFG